MKKLIKLIGIGSVLTGIFGIVYNILQAKKIKEDNADVERLEADGKSIVKKYVFDGAEEKIEVEDKRNIYFICRFGGMDASLIDMKEEKEKITIDIDIRFGGIDLKVPSGYQVINNAKCIMGGIDVSKANISDDSQTDEMPEIILTGKVIFGGLDVHYLED